MIVCPHCGKENKDGTSYCRACGKPTTVSANQSAMETRRLEIETHMVTPAVETHPVSAPPQNYSPAPSPPPSAAPGYQVGYDVGYQAGYQNTPAVQTPVKRRSKVLPILLVIFLIIIGGVVVGGIWLVRKGTQAAESITEEIKKEIPVPDTSTPTTDSVKTFLGDLYYPGSTPEPGLSQGSNRLISLSTTDTIDKVAQYYKSKVTNINPILEESDSFMFTFQKTEKLKGFITAKYEDGQTKIYMAIGDGTPALSPPSYPKPPGPRKGSH